MNSKHNLLIYIHTYYKHLLHKIRSDYFVYRYIYILQVYAAKCSCCIIQQGHWRSKDAVKTKIWIHAMQQYIEYIYIHMYITASSLDLKINANPATQRVCFLVHYGRRVELHLRVTIVAAHAVALCATQFVFNR